MKALCYYQHGDPEVVRYDEVPDPVPGRGEVLVEVKACALNHLDIWVMRGWPGLKLEMPHWGGAGGGVNSASIQIAKLAGAVVYVVASNAEKAEKALELGADFVIDRSRVDWGKEVHRLTGRRGVDLVVDNVGALTLGASMSAAARGGRIAIVGNTSGPLAQIDVRMIFGKQISLIGSTMGTPIDFRDITRMIWSGRIRTVIEEVMPLGEGRRGFEMMARGEQFGKIVFVP